MLLDERCAALANLIAKFDLLNEEEMNKTCIKSNIKRANALLTQELEECKTNLDETSRALGEATSSWDSCLIALQTKQTELEKYTALNDLTNKVKECECLAQQAFRNKLKSVNKELYKLILYSLLTTGLYKAHEGEISRACCVILWRNFMVRLKFASHVLCRGPMRSASIIDYTGSEMCMFRTARSVTHHLMEVFVNRQELRNGIWLILHGSKQLQDELHQLDRLKVVGNLARGLRCLSQKAVRDPRSSRKKVYLLRKALYGLISKLKQPRTSDHSPPKAFQTSLIMPGCLDTQKSNLGGYTVPWCSLVRWMSGNRTAMQSYSVEAETEYQLADEFQKALPAESVASNLVRRIGMRGLTYGRTGRLGINPMIQPEPEESTKDNPKEYTRYLLTSSLEIVDIAVRNAQKLMQHVGQRPKDRKMTVDGKDNDKGLKSRSQSRRNKLTTNNKTKTRTIVLKRQKAICTDLIKECHQ
ncbi:hypothetical protein Tco_0842677 [Tanacetum coccineum]|uniref:Uncharacterized protein n=1 Tax=Tanacetum coccineum TaxID=301880 RepID=A0ABQ5B0F2_9ASTR